MLDFSTLIFRAPALLIALTFHEYAHALAAESMGDSTASNMGRMTLNPLAHLDVMGTILLLVAGFGWAKPVPINPNNFRNYKEGILKVSLAGPGANLFLCFMAILFMSIMQNLHIFSPGVHQFLYWTMLYNVWFAFFNLIPIPPLDGSKILSEFLPYDLAWKFDDIVGRYGFFILIALVFSGFIGLIIGPLSSSFISLCYVIVHTLTGLVF